MQTLELRGLLAEENEARHIEVQEKAKAMHELEHALDELEIIKMDKARLREELSAVGAFGKSPSVHLGACVSYVLDILIGANVRRRCRRYRKKQSLNRTLIEPS